MDHELVLIASPVNIWDRMREAVNLVKAPKGIELGEVAMREFITQLRFAFPNETYTSTDTFTFMGVEVHHNADLHPDDVRVVGAVYN